MLGEFTRKNESDGGLDFVREDEWIDLTRGDGGFLRVIRIQRALQKKGKHIRRLKNDDSHCKKLTRSLRGYLLEDVIKNVDDGHSLVGNTRVGLRTEKTVNLHGQTG